MNGVGGWCESCVAMTSPTLCRVGVSTLWRSLSDDLVRSA